MAKLALSLLAISAVAATVTAAPSPSAFSFEGWVEDIIAHPDSHLSPEQAVAAWEASLNATQPSGKSVVEKRYQCNTAPGTEASVPDAVWCINYLASLGSQACYVNGASTFCTHGNARIVGISGGAESASSSCNDVARGAGFVMDHCTRADNTVQGSEFAYGNGNLLVWIVAP